MEKQLTTKPHPDIDSASTDQTESQPRLPAPVHRTVLLTAGAFFLSAALTGAVVQQGQERFPAELTADVAKLAAPADGVIERMNVEPGQTVLPGTELFIIRDTQLKPRIQVLEAELEQHRSDLAAATARSELEIQRRTVELESAAFETELTLTGLLERQFKRQFESTAWGNYLEVPDALAGTEIPPIDLKSITMPRSEAEFTRVEAMIRQAESENDLEALKTRIELCELRLKELRDSIEQVPSRVTTAHRVPVLKAAISETEGKLDALMNREAERVVRSTIYGMAGVLRADRGDVVKKGDLLLEVFDRDREFVDVALPRRVVPTLNEDQRVTLHFPDGEEGKGKIESIPPQLTGTDETGQSASNVRLAIRPAGKPWPNLPVGSAVEVTIE